MRLFSRQKSSDVPVELQPYYDAPVTQEAGWVRWVVRGLIAAVIIVLLVLLISWAWRETHAAAKKNPAPISDGSQSKAKTTPTANPGASSKPSSDSSVPSTTSVGSNSSTQGSVDASGASNTTTSNLANTGPGETVALFITTVVVGAVLYELRLRTKKTY